MITIYTDAHKKHQPDFETYDGIQVPYAETASRVDSILDELRRRDMLEIMPPKHFPRLHIEAVHQVGYIEFLRQRTSIIDGDTTVSPSYFMTDTYAPLTSGTYEASIAAVDAALTGAHMITNGQSLAYSLCRPPGHHASHHSLGGYCYFNNAAIAANYLSQSGKVAILDIDYHHGNGTQDIFYGRGDVLYVSLHANPNESYPYISGYAGEKGTGEGKGFNINYPLALNTTDRTYLRTLESAVNKIKSFNPAYLIVSAGFDTYNLDPIGGFRLTQGVYRQCGKLIANLGLPMLIIQEGGYNTDDLGILVAEFLTGVSQ